MHYLGQYSKFCLLSKDFRLNSAQIGPIQGSDHRKSLGTALITFIIGNTRDWNRFEEFEQLQCIICVVNMKIRRL